MAVKFSQFSSASPTATTFLVGYDGAVNIKVPYSSLVGGSGTLNYLPKWTSTTALGNSLVFDNGTSVGIGTTSISAATNQRVLEVLAQEYPTLRLKTVAGSVNAEITGNGGNGTFSIATTTTHPMLFWTNNAERMRIFASTGNVAIGTTTDAGFRLDVSGTFRSTGAGIIGTTSTGTTYDAGSNYNLSITKGISVRALDINTPHLSNIQGGSITVSAGSQNDIGGITISRWYGYTAPLVFSDGGTVANPSYRQLVRAGNNNYFSFELNNGSWTNVMTFSNTGNVGIGTTSPTQKLEVNGGMRLYTTGAFSVFAIGATNVGSDVLELSGDTRGSIVNSKNNYNLRFQTNGTDRATFFNSTGNLLLQSGGSQVDNGYRLDVNGTSRIQGQFSVVDTGVTFRASKQSGFNSVDFFSSTSEFSFNNGSGVTIQVPGVTFRHAYAGLTFNGLANSSFVNFKESTTNNSIFYVKNGDTQQWNWAKNLKIDGGTSASECAGSSILELSSTTKGFLPPRMTNAQMTAIATPASGLTVYDTTNNKLNYYNGTAWVAL